MAAHTGSEKLFVVCAQFPFATHDAPGLFLEMLDGEFFHRLLRLELKAAGLEFSDHLQPKHTAGLLSRAYAVFLMRDVAAAARAVAPCLQKWPAFFVVGYHDDRENIFRPLWPEKPAFDLNRYIPELLNAIIQDAPKQGTMIDQYTDNARRRIPPTEPPPAPAA